MLVSSHYQGCVYSRRAVGENVGGMHLPPHGGINNDSMS